ncbi:uncharacterized protein [Palaemon carinicauda]|uniref:uncharacterized protein n=1 Tax=Palaemon carinicauda TaxID=392227 RepID=UPI0035B6979C
MSKMEPKTHEQLTYTSSLTIGITKKNKECREDNPEGQEEHPTWQKVSPEGREKNPEWKEKNPVGRKDNPEWKEKNLEGREGNSEWKEKVPECKEKNPEVREENSELKENAQEWKEENPKHREKITEWQKKNPEGREEIPGRQEESPKGHEGNPKHRERKKGIMVTEREEEIPDDVTRSEMAEEPHALLLPHLPNPELYSHMITDSEEEFQDIHRTLRHYKRGRRRGEGGRSRSPSVDSNCSCSSCDSSENSFFGSEEGPPGGEATTYRRLYLWLEDARYLLNPLIYGALFITAMLTGAAIWNTQRELQKDQLLGWKLMTWTLPLMVVAIFVAFIWQAIWKLLIWKEYGKGDHIENRRSMIRMAQRYGLMYTIRGAIYASEGGKNPHDVNNGGKKPKQTYSIVGWESEYDSQTYFDSDLEPDGQYKKDIAPYREVDDSLTKDRRNIYTRKAWFRDVPIVWLGVGNKSTQYSSFLSSTVK